MPLKPGTKLGPYEIHTPLGAGGMGEVYRARDTRLDRTVAIKVLSSALTSNADEKTRFEREARAISQLQHSHICTLYDVGHQNGTDFLVMEFLEGETLTERLRRGALPLDQVLRMGIEIADALDNAHRAGIVHRDLKPGNIMLTKAGVKLLDFGLAKLLPKGFVGDETLSINASLTAEGTIVGTMQYMSPEQLEGKETDERSDIFSFGAVLYEMATGRHAFDGKSKPSVIAAILEHEPVPISTLQPMAPPALDGLVRYCLAKDAEERIRSAHDVKLQLQWIRESTSQAGVAAAKLGPRRIERHTRWLITALLLTLFGGGGVWWYRMRPTSPAMYFNSLVPFPANDIAVSPDGRTLAIVTYSEQLNNYVIWTHQVGSRGQTAIVGTGGATHPFWSPDGRYIGFFAQGKLKKIDVSGGPPQVLCDAPTGRGGTWNRDGTIIFAPDWFTGLYRVSSAGGTPVEITRPDASRVEQSHRWPVFLPDGRHFLYLAVNFAGQFEKNTILLGSLDSDDKRPIVTTSSNAAFAEPGYLFYMRDNALVAQRFDTRNYVLKEEPHIVSDDVEYFPRLGFALFAVSGNGTVITQTGKRAAKSQLTWFDRTGRIIGTVGPAGALESPSLSPDGKRVAVGQADPDARLDNIWIYQLANDAVTRFTFGPHFNNLPVWSPDGKRIVFSSNRKLRFTLYQKNSDGSGSEEELADLGSPQEGLWDWSRDGKYLLAMKNSEVWYVSLPDRQAKPFLQAKWIVRNAQFSPEGRWVAYSTNETGNWEVYVSPFPSANSRWQVSRGGGQEPRWRRDGKELFYLSADGKMIAVTVKSDSNFEAGPPVALFQTHVHQQSSALDVFSYDVTGDGQKFLINNRVDETNATPLSIILNWASEMEK